MTKIPGITETIFYDGNCGLCHGAVRFVLAADRAGTAFRFAPLDSGAFRNAVSDAERKTLPDSMVLRTADGRLIVQSEAVSHILRRLGGFWRVLGELLWLVPRPIRNWAYDGIARVRKRIIRAPATACPVLPPHLRGRFSI